MDNKKFLGFESANSFVKVFYDGDYKVYPNTHIIAPKESFNVGIEEKQTKQKERIGDRGIDEKIIYEVDGKRVQVGLTTNNYISSTTDSIKRYATSEYYLESVIAMSHFVTDGDEIEVCTDIPSHHYDDKEKATEYITNALKKKHTIKRDGEDISFTVTDIGVILQPLASFFFTLVSQWGKPFREMMQRVENSETLVIDIGWGSTDVAVLLGSGLVDQWTVNTSMKNAYERLAEKLKETAKEEGRKLASAKNIRLLDLEKQVREKNSFTYANEEYCVKGVFPNILEGINNDILREVNNIRSIDSMKTTIFTGGGTKALEVNIVKQLSDEKGRLEENIFIITDSQVANATGCYVFVKYIR